MKVKKAPEGSFDILGEGKSPPTDANFCPEATNCREYAGLG
jgi:hypothetical protein